jgi:hypothetical protein
VKNSGLEGSGENLDINNFMSTKEYAKTVDQEDPLVSYREEFYLNPGMIYMDGNSLGLLSKRALEKFNEVIGRIGKSMGSMAGRRVPSLKDFFRTCSIPASANISCEPKRGAMLNIWGVPI